MAIDIMELDETNLLQTLGRGDWLIALPDNQPDVTISVVWRQQLSNDTALSFARWVIDGVSIDIRHEIDPPWDHSGQAYRHLVDSKTLLAQYEILQEWLDEEYTGNSTASFVSGMGLLWETYSDEIGCNVDDKIFKLLKAHLQAVHDYDEDDDIWMEILDNITSVQSAITHAIMLCIGQMSTAEIWATFQSEARIQIAEEQRQAQERAIGYQAMCQQIHDFWQHHFAELTNWRIEKPDFKTLGLANRLRVVLADTDPSIVEAIVEIGLPGNFSNSVTLEIERIAKSALQ